MAWRCKSNYKVFFFQFSHKSLKVFWCGVQLEVFKKIDSVFHLFCLKSLQSSEVSHVFSFSLPLEPFFIFISLIQQYQPTWWTLKTFEAGHHFYLALISINGVWMSYIYMVYHPVMVLGGKGSSHLLSFKFIRCHSVRNSFI